MKKQEATYKTATELGRMIREGATTGPECVAGVFSVIREKEPANRCYIRLFEKEAMDAAGETQRRIEAGEVLSPLAGVPISVDDNICIKDKTTTGGSRMLENYVPTFSATAVRKLEEAGMILIGKLNIDEFGMGRATETSYFGPTRHPADPGRITGASAAAVASGEAVCALASDAGGALRQAAAWAGVCGLRPTYGTVSRLGLYAFVSSTDQIGAVGHDIMDCAAILNIISGLDPADQTSAETDPINIEAAGTAGLSGLQIGVPEEFLDGKADPEVRESVMSAMDLLRAGGAGVETFSMPELKHAVTAFAVISCAEASANLSRLDGIKYGYRSPGARSLSEVYEMSRSEGFGDHVKESVMLGNYFLSQGKYEAYYLKSLQVKALLAEAFRAAFGRFDLIIGPVTCSAAPIPGAYGPLTVFETDFFTAPASLAGLPAASVPCGTSKEGLPLGLQIIGPHFSEERIVGAAAAFTRARAGGHAGERSDA
ncbi:MAG: amidase [Oscillospiraceae bacterium]|nr:amidase [Oscillospiraceae bacterium]